MQINAAYLSTLTSSLATISNTESQLTNEISSGQRISEPSDDPAAAAQSLALSSAIQADDSYQKASATVVSVLQATDSTLSSVIDQMTQAISVATAGSNGTNNSANLSTAATQLSGIRDELLSLANSSYLGNPLFSGSLTSTQPFVLDTSTNPATVTYNGDSNQSSIQSPSGSTVITGFPGDSIFLASGASVFGTLNALISDYQAGNLSAAQTNASTLTTALANVSQQRVLIDSSITRIQDQDGDLQQRSTQMEAEQTNLIQANTASVATALSSAETQQSALQDAIAALEKQGNLFSVLAG